MLGLERLNLGRGGVPDFADMSEELRASPAGASCRCRC